MPDQLALRPNWEERVAREAHRIRPRPWRCGCGEPYEVRGGRFEERYFRHGREVRWCEGCRRMLP